MSDAYRCDIDGEAHHGRPAATLNIYPDARTPTGECLWVGEGSVELPQRETTLDMCPEHAIAAIEKMKEADDAE